MQTISTKYLGPTNTLPSRIKATTATGVSVTVSFGYDDRTIDEHIKAVKALCAKVKWSGRFIIGATEEGYCAVFANDESFEVQP
jgi:hypothetical protein